jgi:hypothetical protein
VAIAVLDASAVAALLMKERGYAIVQRVVKLAPPCPLRMRWRCSTSPGEEVMVGASRSCQGSFVSLMPADFDRGSDCICSKAGPNRRKARPVRGARVGKQDTEIMGPSCLRYAYPLAK